MSEFQHEKFEGDLTNLERGLLFFEQRRYDLAQKEFEQALCDDPLNSRAHTYLSLSLLEQGRLKEASQAAERAIESAPDYAFAYYAQARAFRRRRQGQKAQAAIEKALALEPSEPDFMGLAAALAADRKDWDLALRLANEGLACDAHNANCHNVRAFAMIRKGQVLPAREALLDLLAHNPQDAMALSNLGWIALQRGQRQEALDYFTRSLAEHAEDESAGDGLLEALRLQYPLYGLVLRYMFWTSRLSDKAQWAMTVAMYFLRKGLDELARTHRRLAPLVNLILWAMSIFNYLTWTARPITSLLLRMNPYGRRILNQDEIDESTLVGLALAGAGGCYLMHKFSASGRTAWLLASIVMMTIVLPASSIYNCEKGWKRITMQVYTGVLLAVGGAATWYLWDAPLSGPWKTLLGLYGIGLLVGQHVGNMLSNSSKERR